MLGAWWSRDTVLMKFQRNWNPSIVGLGKKKGPSPQYDVRLVVAKPALHHFFFLEVVRSFLPRRCTRPEQWVRQEQSGRMIRPAVAVIADTPPSSSRQAGRASTSLMVTAPRAMDGRVKLRGRPYPHPWVSIVNIWFSGKDALANR